MHTHTQCWKNTLHRQYVLFYSLLSLLRLPSNQSVQLVVCTVVDVEWNDNPNPIQKHKHKPEILELQVRIKFWRPVLGERES